MLVELLVENFAVVERLRLRFHAGFNTLTGETGSGKSIVVDALGLLLGGRASAEMVRTGTDRARISGLFESPRDPACLSVLTEAGIDLEDDELLLQREILANGKSRAFVASRPATAALLRDLAPFLGDIHGQHDQQRLFAPDTQLEALDEYAAAHPLRQEVAGLHRRWRGTAAELADLDRAEQDKLRLMDLWTFQRKEIESARLQPGEDESLENERKVLQNVNKLSDSASVAYQALYEAPESAHAQVRLARKRMEDLSRIDASLGEVLELLKPAEVAVQEASDMLRDYLGKLEADPDRLETVEARLASFDKLKRKYGATVAEILAFLENVKRSIDAVESAGERREEILRRQAQAAAAYETAAAQLTKVREKAAAQLSKGVEAELKALAMERASFRIARLPADWSANGADAVQFLFSANVGEEPKPLEKVASGGELSRVSLALKTAVLGHGPRDESRLPRTLVFDEVDAGIGGVAAESVGRRLKRIAAEDQVLCVTHLAQIAGFADHHYAVDKRVANGRTVAVVEELDAEARTREIVRMLSGQRVTTEALRYAEQLIRANAEG